ncbi:MAG TPA: 50S ribosomal protein L29 [Fibrobacteres bacterium]|nr:50S ribosomal protein L29 [Fibrobacterota bacterium]
MKTPEIKALSIQELKEKNLAMDEELFNLRFQAQMGQLSNPVRLRVVRRDIARIKTMITQKTASQAASADPKNK